MHMTILKIIAASGAVAAIALAGCSSSNDHMGQNNSAYSAGNSQAQPSASYNWTNCQTPDSNVGCNSPGNY
jgi:uncharacterized lipoprotein